MQLLLTSSCLELLAGWKPGGRGAGSALQGSLWGDLFHSRGKGQSQMTGFRHVFDVLSHHPGQLSSGNKRSFWQYWPQPASGLPPFGADLCTHTHRPHLQCGQQCQNLSRFSQRGNNFFSFFCFPKLALLSS